MFLCASVLSGALLSACGGGNGSGTVATAGIADSALAEPAATPLVPAGVSHPTDAAAAVDQSRMRTLPDADDRVAPTPAPALVAMAATPVATTALAATPSPAVAMLAAQTPVAATPTPTPAVATPTPPVSTPVQTMAPTPVAPTPVATMAPAPVVALATVPAPAAMPAPSTGGGVAVSPAAPSDPVVVALTEDYTKVADENQAFTIASARMVRYGVPGKWTSRVVAGTASCSNGFFGNDPAVGTFKRCEASSRAVDSTAVAVPAVVKAAPALSAPMGNFPAVDVSKIVTTYPGVSTFNVKTTSEVAPDGDGAFRTSCSVSHMSFDDPIVFPGQTGRSHLHTFFGNTAIDANSTPISIRTTGNSTCRGGIANRSAYWVPTMIDTKDGTPIVADDIGVYYKRGLIESTQVQPIPIGLRMIAGDPAATAPHPAVFSTRFKCIGGPNNSNDKYGPSIANCDVGAQLWQEVMFPQCWDGVNLDSPDHKSHMSYTEAVYTPKPGGGLAASWRCPSTHPVAIPNITFNVIYTVKEKDAPLRWRLSSDNYDKSQPGGFSSHGDWFNGWDDSVSKSWAKNCVEVKKDCHSHLVGDGRMIY